MKLSPVGAGEIREKRCGPGAAVAAVQGKIGVDSESGRLGNRDKHSAGNAVGEICVIFYSFKIVGFGAFILADERIVRAAQRRSKHSWPVQRRERAGRGDDGMLGFDGSIQRTADIARR